MSTLVYFSKAVGFEICFNILSKSTKDNLKQFTTIHPYMKLFCMVADIDIRRIIDGKTYTNLTKNTPT